MIDRYTRQTVLPEVGTEGQARLARASVLVVGAGGLGCAVLQYLSGAGVGRLIIVDHDVVDESNLHRQPLYRMSDVGRAKAIAARDALLAANPNVSVEVVCERLRPDNVAALVARCALVVDAADSLAATYILSDECQRAHKPLVSASVLGLSGYAGVFCGRAPSYRAVFPDMPSQAGSCAQAGVLGSAVGVIGTLQAHMALALILELQPSPYGQLVSVDFKALRFSAFSFLAAPEPDEPTLRFIAPAAVRESDVVIDLRGLEEAPRSPFPSALRMDADTVATTSALSPGQSVVLCCRSGVRAWRAARALRARGHTNLSLIALGE